MELEHVILDGKSLRPSVGLTEETGGRGGTVYLKADPNVHTLLDFKFQAVWKADDRRKWCRCRKRW